MSCINRFLVAGTVLAVPVVGSAQDKGLIDKTVAECVAFVRSYQGDPIYRPSFERFDAYYNPSTGLVENNGTTAGDRVAIFQFNKCMAQNGMPLGAKKSN